MKDKTSEISGINKVLELEITAKRAVTTPGFQKVMQVKVIDKLLVKEVKLFLLKGAQHKKWYINHQQEYYVQLQMKLKRVYQQKVKLLVLVKM